MDPQLAAPSTAHTNQDSYTLHPIPESLDETRRQLLVEKARNFHTLWQQFKEEAFFTQSQYFILSVKFFERWKVYVGYEEVVKDHPPNKFFGSGSMPIINEDICEDIKLDITFGGEYSGLNVVLKQGLQEGKDYIFLNEALWTVVSRDLDDDEFIEVRRKVVDANEGQKVEMYYRKVTLVPISNQILKDVEYEKRSTLLTFTLQASHYLSVEEFTKLVKEQIRYSLPREYSSKIDACPQVKLWLCKENTHKQVLYNSLMQGCKANSTFSYKLFFEGCLMRDQDKMSDYDVLPDSLLVLEIKEWKHDWCFFNKENLMTAACAYCRNVEKLDCLCSCKFVAYCSKQCQQRDRTYHEGRCPTNAESDEEAKQIKENPNSRKGVVGLRNLGNTCFMNSGLQCLSHVLDLTDYFLSNRYLQDINKNNPLGTQGELCTAYAHMLKNLWFGSDSSFSPTQLKRAIGKFQPMFSGYNQHDSGELVTYLLDGLHEDLNRVKVKPYVETKDYDGREDRIVAREQWNNFLLRNQSEVVDLMYGQYRSMLDCPNCKNRSIQFDPFMMCSLPLVNNSLKHIEVTYLERNLVMKKTQISFDKSWRWTMGDLAKELCKKLNKSNSNLVFYVATYATCQIIPPTNSVAETRSEYKYRSIFARELLEGENPQTDIKVVLGNTVTHPYYKDETYRKSLTQYRVHFFPPRTTLKDLHNTLYQQYSEVLPVDNYERDLLNVDKADQRLRLLAIPTTRYSPCEYCSQKGCDGCSIPYDDTTLETFVKKVEEEKVEFQLYWRKNQKQLEDRFEEYESGKADKEEESNGKNAETSIHDCFKLFEESETLAEDNTWYCPKCKEHVRAKKQMQIYKSPKILVLCLKRFKRKEYYQEKHNMLVDFPIENLDMSNYVIDKNLPCGHTEDGTSFVDEMKEKEIQSKPLLYDLFGITNHFGGTGGGHYTAYCKNPVSGQWYDFDDSYVQPVERKGLVSEGAYILFYRRKE